MAQLVKFRSSLITVIAVREIRFRLTSLKWSKAKFKNCPYLKYLVTQSDPITLDESFLKVEFLRNFFF